tara:strand:+ start:80962 stop:82953 length:1992 start_codon:yes stop_codon:yes gene_type:complete
MNDSLNTSDVSKLSVKELQQELLDAKQEIENLKNTSDNYKSLKRNIYSEFEEDIHIYKEMFYTSPILKAVLIGPNFIVKSANPAILQFLGKDEGLIGKPYLKEVPELEEQGLGNLLREVYKTGIPYSAIEMPVYLNINNQLVLSYYDFVYQAHRNIDGDICGVVIMVTDVSSRVKLNEELKISNHRFQELIFSSPGLIAVLTGKDFIIEIANDAIIDIWGKGPDVIGKPIFKVLPEILEQGMDKKFEEVFNSGKPLVAQEFPIMHERDGKLVEGYFDFIYQPQKDINGKIIGVAVIANEVSKTAKLNQKIRESELKFRQLANLIPDKISNADENLNTFYYNQSWLDYSGLTLDYLLENGWTELVHPDDVETITRIAEDALRTKSDVEMELRFKDKNGDYKWHLSRATAVRDENGDFQSWVSATTQIHKIKEEEKRKEEFLKMVSHELKTPVTSIRGYTQLLLSMIKENEAIKSSNIPLESSLRRIDNQINRLIRLISEMLDLSRIEDNQLVLQKSKFNINDLVEHTVQDIKISNPNSDVKIEHKFKTSIFADKERIEQVLVNFITNAIKYSPNSKNIDIKIFQEVEGKVSVSIRDFGIGITKAHIKKIFTRFYRVDGKNEETYSGFGIGLFLVNEIIERHEGTIKVNSKKGNGSEFIFTLNTI